MPCNSAYMEASGWEKSLSRVACLLDELDGELFNADHWRGYHPRVYNRGLTKNDADDMVARLCERLQHCNVQAYSLEMQIWWRDHQAADVVRRLTEAQASALAAVKARARAKLTEEELKALGL